MNPQSIMNDMRKSRLKMRPFKIFRLLRGQVAPDLGVFVFFFAVFLLLNWRLFAFGSQEQLFLYGDNLPILNNLFFLFNNFSFAHPFGTFIGQNGMLGSYPMAEPQSSIFYPPITLLFGIYRIFDLQVVGLYYELLFLHLAHFLLGVFFIYRICQKMLEFSRAESIFSGLVYLGIGWNAAWFGTGTLSYMIGLLPFVMYFFLRYLKAPSLRFYILFVLSLTFFLYAGGLINFFFYLLGNLFLLFSAFIFFRYEEFPLPGSRKECAVQYGLLFFVAPILSLLAYSVQLFITYSISADISHSSTDYDYLAFFGMHFYDLIGFIFPKFSLLHFGWVTNPRIILEFSLANVLYVGFIPLILILLGALSVKNRIFTLFAGMAVLNLLLSFGGAFLLYDATYFFPGNNLFRGHYKYLFMVGVYLALSVPFVLRAIQRREFSVSVYKKFQKYLGVYFFVLLIAMLVSGVAAFSFKVLQKDNVSFPTSYFTLALTFLSYFSRMLMIGLISWFSMRFFFVHNKAVAVSLLALILITDISVNFKYNMYYGTKIQDLVSKSFFQCCQRKTVVSDMSRYSQAYHIPEITETDLFFNYSAIPNRYLVEYNGYLKDSSGKFNIETMKTAGINGIITDDAIDDSNLILKSSKEVTRENYEKLYVYNGLGNLDTEIVSTSPGVY